MPSETVLHHKSISELEILCARLRGYCFKITTCGEHETEIGNGTATRGETDKGSAFAYRAAIVL